MTSSAAPDVETLFILFDVDARLPEHAGIVARDVFPRGLLSFPTVVDRGYLVIHKFPPPDAARTLQGLSAQHEIYSERDDDVKRLILPAVLGLRLLYGEDEPGMYYRKAQQTFAARDLPAVEQALEAGTLALRNAGPA